MILMRRRRFLPAAAGGFALAAVIAWSAHAQEPEQRQRRQTPVQAPATAPSAQGRPGAASTPPKPAAQQPASAPKPGAPPAAPGGPSATRLASFDDWSVYTAQSGRSKICYALSQPKERMPKNLSRDPAYLFVSFRPGERVRNELALVMGFVTKENGPAEASVGTVTYPLLTKDANAWLKNAAEEGQAIATMAKAQNLTVKVQSRRGNQLTDRYSLSGFAQALDRARKECS
jgi:hypothetical protein